jgi:hypothetical protein
MTKYELIEWIYDLPLQTLTDELKEEIVSEIENMMEDEQRV